MQIVALVLENVKSYEHARFAFTPGVNAIVGHNGAGKSTVIEAIGYALFDALPYTVQEFVREGVRTGSIAVTFLSTYDERPYRVERRFGGSNAYAVYDEELGGKVCDGKADALAFVRRHTLADPTVDLTRLFNDALGVAQGSLTTAFAETPARRKPIFDALLQVDDYSTASDRLREPARRLREQLVETDRTLAVLAARLERLPLLEQAIEQRTRDLAHTGEALEHIKCTLQANQEQLELLEAQKATVDSLTAQMARQEETVRSLEAQQRRAEAARAEAGAAAAVVAANQPGHDAYLAAQQEQESLQVRAQQRQSLLSKQATIDKHLALAAARCAQIEQELAEVAVAETTVRDLAEAVQQQSELEDDVITLERVQNQLAELERRIAVHEMNRQKLIERHAALTANRHRARIVEEEGQEIVRRLEEVRAELEQMREQSAFLRSAIANVEQQSEALEDIDAPLCPVCEQPLTAEHRSEMLARNREHLIELRRQVTDRQAAVTAKEHEISTLEEARARLQREWTELPREAEVTDVMQALSGAERDLADIAAERSIVAEQATGLAQARRALVALGDPRSRSTVAAARAAQRPKLAVQLAVEQERQHDSQQQSAAVEASLQAVGDLDGALQANTAALRQHKAAYQAVLTNRQVAESFARRVAEVGEAEDALKRAHTEMALSRADLEIAIHQFDLTHYQQLLLDERKLREELGSLSASLTSMRSTQANDETHLLALRNEQANQRVLEVERLRLTRQEEVLDAIRSIIKQAGPYVTQAIVRQVSEGAATIFGELMQDHRRVLAWEADYGVTLTTDGVARSFRQLSGGEQMSAALAVRLALVREMSSINVAFFDEPTANLDSVRRESLAQQIMTVRGFNQLFVISHDDTFEQATQNLIRVKRHGNVSVIGDSSG
ncbi:MAG: SMC family ATPase [Caldilinea sp.]